MVILDLCGLIPERVRVREPGEAGGAEQGGRGSSEVMSQGGREGGNERVSRTSA